MSACNEKDIAIIIPARNEADRIAACLTALSGQMPSRTMTVLVVNNTTDDTCKIAKKSAKASGLDIVVVNCVLTDDEGVGTARKIGCDHAISMLLNLRFLLTTDADCVAADDWVSQNICHLSDSDLVCGKVDVIPSEAAVLDLMDKDLATQEEQYRSLVQEFYARHAYSSASIRGTHGEAAGASLGMRAEIYQALGGFAALKCAEDRQLCRTFRSAGKTVLHADDVRVFASCRLEGRAAGGMSDALKARTSGDGYLIDDCLPNADWLAQNLRARTLGVWPPQVQDADRVHVRQLRENIHDLTEMLDSAKVAEMPSVNPNLSETSSLTHREMPLSDRGAEVDASASRHRSGAAMRIAATVPDQIQTLANAKV